MPESGAGIPASTIIVSAGLAGLAYLGYQYWWLPEKQRRAQEALLRAEMERQARASGRSGSALDIVGVAGCMAAGQALGIPLPVSAPICGAVGPQLPKLAYGAARGAVKGAASGARGAGSAIVRAGGETVSAVARPIAKVGRGAKKVVAQVGDFFERIF